MSGNQFFHLSANGRFGAIGNNLGVLKLVKRNAVLLSPRTIFVGNGHQVLSRNRNEFQVGTIFDIRTDHDVVHSVGKAFDQTLG